MLEFLAMLGVFIASWWIVSVVFSYLTTITFNVSAVIALLVCLLLFGLVKGNINLNINR